MTKSLLSLLLIALLSCGMVFAGTELQSPPTEEEIAQGLTVIMDCLSASLVTSCTDSNINLSCSNVSMNYETNLPIRIAYFLADPSEYVTALAPNSQGEGFFAALLALLNNAVEDPLVSAVYIAMSTRGYQLGDYLLTGSISFSYPDGVTLDDVLNIWASREFTDQKIGLNVEMSLYGSKLLRPLSVSGNFDMGIDREGDIVVNAVDIYKINEYSYSVGTFRF